tara:strand:+ start:138 stop:281 length:144 start_codon:yes stop_codon:yes gene_type:complete
MNFDYLFHQELPKGIKSIYVNRKRMSIKDFKKAKERFLAKKADKKDN